MIPQCEFTVDQYSTRIKAILNWLDYNKYLDIAKLEGMTPDQQCLSIKDMMTT
jgi:hypothetical protein